MTAEGIVLVTGGSRGIGAATALEAGIASGAMNKQLLESPTAMNLPVDAGYIAGTTWAAYGGLPKPPGASA